ncbi:hypothetical protein GCM10011609_35260 [Lentzea pudingi]|uniref:Uncharacterized protein n=1 Tax=Lentzea pudingi TaxID=1789439 RepID=A0ABQ2HYS6_9PSEU|nr:hypothetical protein GCM10011609_35260 [Lentzea pudingi]
MSRRQRNKRYAVTHWCGTTKHPTGCRTLPATELRTAMIDHITAEVTHDKGARLRGGAGR